MELLRLMRGRGAGLTGLRSAVSALLAGGAFLMVGCDRTDPELLPDERLRAELGLTDADRVHTIELRTGVGEQAAPDSLEVYPSDLVQFVSTDWMVHEVAFPIDALGPAQRDFLERTGQLASPPLLQQDARFVLSFRDAPAGRYPFRLQGNRASGDGVVIVVVEEGR